MPSRTLYLAISESRFLSIVAPVLQALVAIAVSILLCFLFLGKMTIIIRSHLAHVNYIVLVVLGRIPLRILLQDLNDLPTTGSLMSTETAGRILLPFMPDAFSGPRIMAPTRFSGSIALEPFF